MRYRIQVVVGDMLVMEAVLEDMTTADSTWASYTRQRVRDGLHPGGAIIQRADMPRKYDVPVGEKIR